MNISPIKFTAPKVTSFKGQENESPKSDAEKIANAINQNTATVEKLVDKVNILTYTIYATEKAKSGTNGLHQDSYSNTSDPVAFVNYVNRNWTKPRYY